MVTHDAEYDERNRAVLRNHRVAVAALLATTLAASVGWFLSAREGRGIPPECYSVSADAQITFQPAHGSATRRATFAVAEDSERVMLG